MDPFWNGAEHRPRAGWRILLLAAIIFSLTTGGTWLFTAAFAEHGLAARVLARTSITLLVTALSLWVGGRLIDRRHIADFGLHVDRVWWVDFGVGLLLGALLMALVFGVEWSAGWVAISGAFATGTTHTPFAAALLLALMYYAGVAINEEILTRGYGLRNLAEGLNLSRTGARRAIVYAWLLSSAVFGLLHIGNPNATLVSTVNIMLVGMLFGLPYILTGRIALSIGMHLAWNFFQGNVFGLPVSGGGSQITMLATIEQGPDLWTGGAFGPEGGLVGIVAIALGCLLVLAWVRRRQHGVTLHLPLAQYTPRATSRASGIARRAPSSV